MYVDKLDGVVDAAFFGKMSNQWREEQLRCPREIGRHQEADKSYLDKGVELLDLARNAQRLFAMQESREKRRPLNFVLSNCNWEDGEVVATFRERFDMLAETATTAARTETDASTKSAKSEIWLGEKDSKSIGPAHIGLRQNGNRTFGVGTRVAEKNAFSGPFREQLKGLRPKHLQNRRNLEPLAPGKYDEPNLAGGVRGTGIEPSPPTLRYSLGTMSTPRHLPDGRPAPGCV